MLIKKLKIMLFLGDVAIVTFSLCTLVIFFVFNSVGLTHTIHNITLMMLSFLLFIVCRINTLKILNYLIKERE